MTLVNWQLIPRWKRYWYFSYWTLSLSIEFMESKTYLAGVTFCVAGLHTDRLEVEYTELVEAVTGLFCSFITSMVCCVSISFLKFWYLWIDRSISIVRCLFIDSSLDSTFLWNTCSSAVCFFINPACRSAILCCFPESHRSNSRPLSSSICSWIALASW